MSGQPGGVTEMASAHRLSLSCPFLKVYGVSLDLARSKVLGGRNWLCASARKGQRPHMPRLPLSAGIAAPRRNQVGARAAAGFHGTGARGV